MLAERKPLDATAVSVMVLLCLIWGIGHVAAKFASQGISLVFQSGVRSVVALSFGDGFASGRGTLLGDFFGMLAAAFWAATTVLIRATKLAAVSATKTLFYQLAISGPVLLA